MIKTRWRFQVEVDQVIGEGEASEDGGEDRLTMLQEHPPHDENLHPPPLNPEPNLTQLVCFSCKDYRHLILHSKGSLDDRE